MIKSQHRDPLCYLGCWGGFRSYHLLQQYIHLSFYRNRGRLLQFRLYIIVKILKRHFRCSRCQQIMDVIDVKWTPEQWQLIQGYELLENFKGADGNLYTTEREKSAGSTHYFIHAHIQRWYACHQCYLYFLNAKYLRESLLSTLYKDEFEQAKRSLLSDPEASEKMDLAYKARLQGRQKSE